MEEDFNCGRTDGSRGGDDFEEPVNYLAQFPVPCLICGTDLEVDSFVKHEVCDFDSSLPVEGSLLNWFLKWFRVDIQLITKRKQRVKKREEWEGDCAGDGDDLKFCGICKNQLLETLALQRQLDELEKKIKNGLEVVKGNMERCEKIFQSNGVYERDPRYKRVRSRIIKSGDSRYRPPNNIGSSEGASENPNRNPDRKKPPVSRLNFKTNNKVENQLLNDPMLSSSNQTSIQECPRPVIQNEERYLEVDIKPDIISEDLGSPPTNVRSSAKKKNVAKVKKKLGTRSRVSHSKNSRVSTKANTPKAPAKAALPILTDDGNDTDSDYFLDDIINEESSDDDYRNSNDDKQSSSRPQRKRRKIHFEVDEDFTLDGDADNSLSEDDNDKNWSFRSEGYKRWNYKLDPTSNTITAGSFTFTISNDQTKVTCNTCSSAPSMRNDKDCMRRHLTKYHTDRFTCPHCPFRGEHSGSLRIHIEAVHEGKARKSKERFPCKICGKPVKNQRNHEWSHMSQEEKDEVAKKEPRRLPDWMKSKIQCEDCGKEFSGRWHLGQHRKREHEGVEKEKELCPECGGTFKNLEKHRKTQHGGEGGGKTEGTFECLEEGCGKKFRKLRLLTRHKNAVHWKIRPWKCEVCGREFSGEERFKDHLNGHLGVRPWKCEGEGCEAAFNRKSHLQRHMRIYHEEGSRPKRKVFLRGPTVLGADFKKKELQKEGTYYPPSALKGWAKGRVPGHLVGKGEENS